MKVLENKVAVVTGAASGIGRAIATELSSAGCVLALVDINPDTLDVVVHEIAEATFW